MSAHLTPQLEVITGGIRCPFDLVNELSEQAQAGYQRVRWGGVERGGILLGQFENDELSIIAAREVDCEHAFGPSYQLSQIDTKNLENALAAPPGSLAVVGWYRTSSRALEMTFEDREIHRKYFREPWQVALIIHRNRERQPCFGPFRTDPGVRFGSHHLIGEFTAESVRRAASKTEPSTAMHREPAEAVPVNKPAVTILDAPRKIQNLAAASFDPIPNPDFFF